MNVAGGTWTQQSGISEIGNSDFNLFSGNELDANAASQLVISGTHSKARDNTISGALIPPVPSTPTVPATTVAQQNATGHDVVVYMLSAATVTAVTVGSTSCGLGGMYLVPAGQTITLTYPSGTPTWVWMALG